ncbi:MAG: Rid family detoxifying hydrolase [Acidobacteriota bacterium]
MIPTAITSSRAPAAIGPYSQAMRAGGFVFCSGQVALDPATGQLVPGGVSAQTERVLDNLAAVLDEAGSGLDLVVKTTVYLASMADFAEMNQVYERRMPGKPARATVAVKELPRAALVEIDAVAVARQP